MKFPNLHDPGKKAADISKDGEHEGDPDDAEEKAEDATSDRLRRHVPVTDRCDDREGEKARLTSTYLFEKKHALTDIYKHLSF